MAKKKIEKKVTNAMLAGQLKTLQSSMKAVQEWMSVHELEDNRRFKEGAADAAKLSDGIFNPDGTEKLASKKDVAEVVKVFGNIEKGALAVTIGGKWTFRALLVAAAVVTALTAIFIGGKALLAFFFHGLFK